MSRIKSSNTSPELIVRKFLHKNGFRYKVNENRLPGKPDIVLVKYRTVIFVNGCFWHGHEDCRYFSMPKTRTEFWEEKIEYNRSRDARNILRLESMGWKVLIVWQCQLKADQIEALNNIKMKLLINSAKKNEKKAY